MKISRSDIIIIIKKVTLEKPGYHTNISIISHSEDSKIYRQIPLV